MADKLFVFPNHDLHKDFRRITRTCPLIERLKGYVTYDFNGLSLADKDFVSDKLFSRAKWAYDMERDGVGGINLANRSMEGRFNYPFRQVGYRLHGCHVSDSYDFNYPTAFEVLRFGIGVMIPLNKPMSSFHAVMGGDGLPMISSEHLSATYSLVYQDRTSHDGQKSQFCWKMQLTNLIFADTYGELEQLVRLPNKLLEVYLENMNFASKEDLLWYQFGCLEPLWRKHAASGLWNAPPKNARALRKRAEFILKHTFVDNDPLLILKPMEYGEGRFGDLGQDGGLKIVK